MKILLPIKNIRLHSWLVLLLGLLGSWASAQNLTLVNKVAADDGAANDYFAESVAISGDQAIVGAYQDDNFIGAAYIFQKNSSDVWVQIQKLTIAGGESGDQFGWGVSIDGDQAIVGARNDGGTGASYIFQKNGSGVWEQVQRLTPSNPESVSFGSSNAIRGNQVFVGAIAEGPGGAAYVFQKDGNGQWNQAQRLTPSDGSTSFGFFGNSVAFDGDFAIIGANQGFSSGSAYIFQKNGSGIWVEVQKISPNDPSDFDYFGFDVAISGNQAFVGSYGNNNSAGAVYVFQSNGSGIWEQSQKLVASGTTGFFGLSVSVSGDQSLIGAYRDDERAADAGAAFRFTKDGAGTWTQAQKTTASDGAAGDLYGYDVAIDGTQAIIGAFGDNASQGSAYMYLAEAAPTNLLITSLDPVRNEKSAPAATNVAITFSEPMATDAATLGAVKVFSHQRGGLMQNGSQGTTTVSGSTLSFDPTTDFKPGETVYVTTTTAAQGTGGGVLGKGHVHQFTAEAGGTGRGNFQLPAVNAEVATGSRPIDIVLGDVDGDGDLDFLTANATSNTLSLGRNDGAGSFTDVSTIPTTHPSQGLTLGDVDGDGDLDLVIANYGDNFPNPGNTVSIRVNDGAGNFTAPTTGAEVQVEPRPRRVALGDLDGDGDLDMVVSVDNNSTAGVLTVHFNNGSGVFGAGTLLSTIEDIKALKLGDIDGDGDLDLLLAIQPYFTGEGSVVLRINDGTGTFTEPASGASIEVELYPQQIALGDVDGDGDLDFVTANTNGGSVSLRLNDGAGLFSTPTGGDFSAGSGTIGASLSDVDADGDLDLLVAIANSGRVRLWLNNGTGTFTPASTNATIGVGDNPFAIATADIDGDGDLDFVTANANSSGSVSVRLNQPFEMVTQADLSITKTDGISTVAPGGSVTYTITASNAGPSPVTGATVADVLPASLTNATWTCAGAGGGTCTASGSGSINDLINLPSGGSVTYTVSATVSPAATGTLSNTATVTTPEGVTDPTPGNNSVTDTDNIVCPSYQATLGGSTTIQSGETANLIVTIPEGIAPYTVVYSNGITNITVNNYQSGANIPVSPTQTTTYSLVSVTGANNCPAATNGTATVTVQGQDFSCGSKGQNVLICYYGVTQCVSKKIADRYLKLGATMGGCGSSAARIGYEQEQLELSLNAFPNPVQDELTLEVLAPVAGAATFEVLDIRGQARQTRRENLLEGKNEIEFRLGTLPAGVYIIRARDKGNMQTAVRIFKQ